MNTNTTTVAQRGKHQVEEDLIIYCSKSTSNKRRNLLKFTSLVNFKVIS